MYVSSISTGSLAYPLSFPFRGLHHLADAVQHEPSRLLGNADCAGHLVAGDAVLAVGHHPEGDHPFVESDGAVLEDRTYLEGELLLAGVAVPNLPGLDEGVLFPAAPGAGDNPVRPAKVQSVLEGAIHVREVNNRLLQCFRAVHDSNLRPNSLCVKSIITFSSSCYKRIYGSNHGGGTPLVRSDLTNGRSIAGLTLQG